VTLLAAILSKFRHTFIILTGIAFGSLWIQDAYGYIDPGSTSMFLQVILGVLVGVGVAVKIYWEKIKLKLLKR